MVYLVKSNGKALAFRSEERMQAAGFNHADLTVTDEAYNGSGCYARIIDGEIVIGRTQAEIDAEERSRQIADLRGQLEATDYVAAKIAEGSATAAEYAAVIAQRQAWRAQINALSAAG